MTLHQQMAYGLHSVVRSPKDTEYDIIARVTQQLSKANVPSEKTSRLSKALLEALHLNERLWSTLATDVALEENGLPASLRAKLFYLYRFTHHHSAQIRQGVGDVGVLIDINTAVLRGLRGGE